MKKAVFAGSFDPFTNGHLAIVKKAAKMFDKVTIIIGVNSKKKKNFDVKKMEKAIAETLKDHRLDNCNVIRYEGMIALYCKENNIDYTVRGLRNNMDFNYEDEITKTNKLLNPTLETVYFPSEDNVISSSMVKEFMRYGINVSQYVPIAVLIAMQESFS